MRREKKGRKIIIFIVRDERIFGEIIIIVKDDLLKVVREEWK